MIVGGFMQGESFNLIQMIREYLPDNLIDRFASVTGESSERTRSGITAAVPGILSGMDRAASTPDGVRRMNSAIDDADDGLLDNPIRMFDPGFSKESGSGLLSSIMGGGGLSDLTNLVTGASGLSGKGMTAMLSMLAPIVFGVLKRLKRTTGANRFDIASLLAGQRGNISAALPERAYEDYSRPRAAGQERAARAYTETETHHRPSWLLPLALLAGALGLLWFWSARPSRDTAFSPPSRVQAGRDAGRDDEARRVRSSEALNAKYSAVLREARDQGIDITDFREHDGKLVIKGRAPSLEAANKVWDEIKRVDPKLDDITADFPVAASSLVPSTDFSTKSHDEDADVATREKPTEMGSHTYIVEPGDTLGSISKRFYGNTGDYKRILDANRDKIENRDLISVGQELSIPE